MLIENEDGQWMLFGPGWEFGKTSQVVSAPPMALTLNRYSNRSLELKNQTLMLLDLRPGAGNMLGPYWEIDPVWLGCNGTLNTTLSLNGASVCSLSSVLQTTVPFKYYLTRQACLGILRRAKERGKELPPQLELALKVQAGLLPPDAMRGENRIAFATNQRDEVRDLHDVAGALGAQPKWGPMRAQQSGSHGERSRSGMDELSPSGGSEGYGACGDAKQRTFVAAGVVSKGNGECFLSHEKHTSLSTGGGQAGQGYPCVLTECLTPWDTQQARIFTPEGKAPTVAGADGGGGRNPAGLVFTAGFCAGASPTAGSVGYHEEITPTLKAANSGTNQVPAVLCLNDEGGKRIDLSQDVTGTLRAQNHGHEPLIMSSQPKLFENHGADARYQGPCDVAPTMSAYYGSGGNNEPLVRQKQEAVYCITGNIVDRKPQNGGNGIGYQEDISYTLTATDKHCVFSRQRVDVFREDDIASTESARQHKDATDLVYQKNGTAEAPHLIRKLLPSECELLQGFPLGWTDIPGVSCSDAARFKALGNSVAVPCVQVIMEGIVKAFAHPENVWKF